MAVEHYRSLAAGLGFPSSIPTDNAAVLVVCVLAVTVGFGALLTRPSAKVLPQGLRIGLFAAFGAAVGLAIVSGFLHDYRPYLSQWDLVLMGRDPWLQVLGNAYGPLYNLLAYLYDIDRYLPKLTFVFAWFASSLYLLRAAYNAEISDRQRKVILCVVLSPMFVILVALFGSFDVLVAALCLLSIWLLDNEKPSWAGVVLAGAALLKYYPVVLLPVVVITTVRRDSIRLVAGFAAMSIATIAMTLVVWGNSFLDPLLFAEDRGATGSSVFLFLDGRFSPLRVFTSSPNVSAVSHLVMAFAFAACLLVIYRLRLTRSVACVLGLTVTLMFYRVGHAQFQMALIFLMMYMLIHRPASENYRSVMRWMLAYIGVYNVLVVAYAFTGYLSGAVDDGFRGDWEWMRDISGLPAFIVATGLVVAIVRERGFRDESLGTPAEAAAA
ncbi:MAG: DUF2029 domain-containing protein [Acidimicrobiia bacterium]|nr:DUF2029 domain-containing protein [Acidimicrobiia bacterium]MBP8181372.1 DUF2029 domain-containing protein [Acidimicrobiia bacterium]